MDVKGSGVGEPHVEAVEQLQHWLRGQLMQKNVPRLHDVWKYAQANVRPKLSRKQVATVVRLNKHYLQVMPQQRIPKRSRKYRPIITNALGYMHGDVGFFSVQSHYPTPPKYRAGFLVLVDVLSRLVYLEVLHFNRKAPAIIAALKKILDRHNKTHDYPIRGLSFDLERSVISNKMQKFLHQHHIKFTSFKLSQSKAKFAENAIRLVRQKMDVLEKHNEYKQRWWNLLDDVEKMLNNRPIMINNALLPFTPAQVTGKNVHELIAAIQQRSPAHYFSQFNIDPRLVQFKYRIGDYVKAKTIVTSSSVLGLKRSVHQLTVETFIIVQRKPYFNRDSNIGVAYLCKDINSEVVHEFNEEDLALVEPSWS